jgi:glycosyltransferase involved in cell wall biosynthesis
MQEIISLIIPIYNVENYIADCLDSVFNQLVDGVEIILVNDGTPDKSMEIAENLIQALPLASQRQVKTLQQKNQGQSVARNNAINIATGQYIAFLDSDDVLEPTYFSVLINNILKHQPDIIQFKSFRFSTKNNHKETFHVGAKIHGYMENTSEIQKHVFNQSAWFPWLNIYKKALFSSEDIFPAGIYYEDAALIPTLFLKAKNINFLPDVLYGYRYNTSGSLMNMSSKNIEKHIISFNYVIELYRDKVKNNKLYSSSIVSLTQGYFSFLLKHKGLKVALREYKYYKLDKKYIDEYYLEKRGNILFYKFGLFFLIFTKLIGKD